MPKNFGKNPHQFYVFFSPESRNSINLMGSDYISQWRRILATYKDETLATALIFVCQCER